MSAESFITICPFKKKKIEKWVKSRQIYSDAISLHECCRKSWILCRFNPEKLETAIHWCPAVHTHISSRQLLLLLLTAAPAIFTNPSYVFKSCNFRRCWHTVDPIVLTINKSLTSSFTPFFFLPWNFRALLLIFLGKQLWKLLWQPREKWQ